MGINKYSGEYGPAPKQEGLRPLYDKVAEADIAVPSGFRIKDIYCFKDQKHGMKPKHAIAFGIVLENGAVIKRAGVMGGISAGIAEPGTHKSIDEAIDFFYNNVRKHFIGLNVSRSEEITNKIIELDDKFKSKSGDTNKPRFSYIGSEISVGISMICSIGFAERLGVPLEIILNYRYNKYCLTKQLSEEKSPITIPVNYSVVWEGGKHGAAFTLNELVEKGIIKDDSEFPEEFREGKKFEDRDKSILLGIVPPQEVQIMAFTSNWEQARNIGIKLTKIYQDKLEKRGIDIQYGAESGCTTKQTHTNNFELITLELILDILNEATDELGDESRYVRWALDIASSEMYIKETDKYYIGPSAAKNKSGLVTNDEFTEYKLELFKKYPRFISVEDWADESKVRHWLAAKQIMPHIVILKIISPPILKIKIP